MFRKIIRQFTFLNYKNLKIRSNIDIWHFKTVKQIIQLYF